MVAAGALSKTITGPYQGQLQGGIEAVDGIGRVMGPIMASQIYSHFQHGTDLDTNDESNWGDRTFWFVSSGWTVIALVVMLFAAPPCGTDSRVDTREVIDSLKHIDAMDKSSAPKSAPTKQKEEDTDKASHQAIE